MSVLRVLLFVSALLASACSVSAPVDDSTEITTSGGPDTVPSPVPTEAPQPTAVPTEPPQPTAGPTTLPTSVAATPVAPANDEQGETIGEAAGRAIATAWADAWGLRGGGAACWNDSAPAALANVAPEWLTTGDDPELEQFIAGLVMTCGIEDEVIGTALEMVLGLSEDQASCVTASLDSTELTIASAAAIGNQGNKGQDGRTLQTLTDASGCVDADSANSTTTDASPGVGDAPVPPPPADDAVGELAGPSIAATVGGLWGLSGQGAACWNENASVGFSNASIDWLETGDDPRLEQFLSNVVLYCDIAVEVIASTLNFDFNVPLPQSLCIAESLSPDELIIGAAAAIGDQGNTGQREVTIQLLIDSYPDCAA